MIQIIKIGTGAMLVNTYLAWDSITKKGFIVDPGGYSSDLYEYINKECIDIEYIILTHGHGDHIGGVDEFKKRINDVKVIAAKSAVLMLENPDMNMSKETCGKEIRITPDVLVNENDEISIGKLNLKFIMTPGHTPGGMSVYVENILFSGDTLFQQSVGRTDFPGGNQAKLVKSIKNKLFVLPDDTRVLPGHMGETTIGYEKENNPFV